MHDDNYKILIYQFFDQHQMVSTSIVYYIISSDFYNKNYWENMSLFITFIIKWY